MATGTAVLIKVMRRARTVPSPLSVIFDLMPNLQPVLQVGLNAVRLNNRIPWIAAYGKHVGISRCVVRIIRRHPIGRGHNIGRPQGILPDPRTPDEHVLGSRRFSQPRPGLGQSGLSRIKLLGRPPVVSTDFDFRGGGLQDDRRHNTDHGNQQHDGHKSKAPVPDLGWTDVSGPRRSDAARIVTSVRHVTRGLMDFYVRTGHLTHRV